MVIIDIYLQIEHIPQQKKHLKLALKWPNFWVNPHQGEIYRSTYIEMWEYLQHIFVGPLPPHLIFIERWEYLLRIFIENIYWKKCVNDTLVLKDLDLTNNWPLRISVAVQSKYNHVFQFQKAQEAVTFRIKLALENSKYVFFITCDSKCLDERKK